jgi:ATP-dependent DNA helicase RecG
MNLPININDLLTARTVEWERLEFKAGWNPEAVLHTMCAFANDFHNLGGGYIIIGVEEDNGCPILPPVGLPAAELDAIQKEVVELGHRMVPYYHPIIAPCEVDGKQILVLWATGGQTRPYRAPVSLAKGEQRFAYYIRKGSVTIRARHQDETELMSLAATVPFDDRMNQGASLDNLDLGLIRTYLKQVKSDLFREAVEMDFIRLCRQMNIVDGPDESVRPKNVGLMFFNDEPSQFFPQTQIDVVHFPEGPGANSFTEKTFKGPIHTMLQDALSHIRSMVIEEKVVKHPDRAEADRFFNYPFPAIEEALCNAVYHRSYEIREPVEVRILPDSITVGSFPGPDRSIRDQDMREFRFLSRRYRNRRVGEFLKELEMTEGRGTGIPKMLREIDKNGSPKPIFHTDDDRTFFIAEFPVHLVFTKVIKKEDVMEIAPEVTPEVTPEVERMLAAITGEMTRGEIQKKLSLKDEKHFREYYQQVAVKLGLIEMTIPDKPRSRLQKYRLTATGEKLLKELKKGKRD